MLQITTTSKYLIAASVFALLAIIGFIYLFADIKKMNRAVTTVLSELSIEAARENRLRGAKALAGDIEQQRVILASRFVGSDGVVLFIETVEDLGKVVNLSLEITAVNIEELANAPAGSRDLFESLRLSISAKGSWREVFHFLSLIEELPFQVSVVQAQFEQPQESNDWKASFTVLVTKFK